MTANRRIFLNIVATYGRSLYALVIGLFCGRWTLMALGEVDYGLMGVVGGLTVFISFFNGILAGGVSRFYAINVGLSKSAPDVGLEKCREWFTTAIVIHTIAPLILMSIGYPAGEWVVRNFLTIPPDRIQACVWVWRFVCISCFLGMASVPMNAMYGAHQYIAELTIYSFVTTTLNVCFLYYMITHPGVWLTRFAFWQLLLGLMPSLIISLRAFYLFPECRFKLKYARCWKNVKMLFGYTMWNIIGACGAMFREQGIAVLVNKYFGPRVNAGVAVGTNLSGQANMLNGGLVGALSPALFNAYGAGDLELAKRLALRICKIGTLLILIFAIPLSLESENVLLWWLREPPKYAAAMCVFVLVMNVISQMSLGHLFMVQARGRLKMYQIVCGGALVMTLPIAWAMIEFGFGVYSVGCAMVATMLFCTVARVWMARTLVDMSAKLWLRQVLIPIAMVVFVALLAGAVPRFLLQPTLYRICLTTIVAELALIPISWSVLLDQREKAFIADRIKRRLQL